MPTKLVGILNVTPDSFSDGGRYFTAADAVAHIETLIQQGADIIDIGAESTRPGATPLSSKEEWARLEPLAGALAKFPHVAFSLDTRHATTAERMLTLGITCINDVSGFADAAMVAAVRDNDCSLVVMHSLGVPADKNVVLDEGRDVISQLLEFGRARIDALARSGVAENRIIFDPGIGFGKTAQQSRAIIERIEELRVLGVPLYVGHSRKSFLMQYAGSRDEATLEVSKWLVAKGVEYLRVHDVAAHRSLMA